MISPEVVLLIWTMSDKSSTLFSRWGPWAQRRQVIWAGHPGRECWGSNSSPSNLSNIFNLYFLLPPILRGKLYYNCKNECLKPGGCVWNGVIHQVAGHCEPKGCGGLEWAEAYFLWNLMQRKLLLAVFLGGYKWWSWGLRERTCNHLHAHYNNLLSCLWFQIKGHYCTLYTATSQKSNNLHQDLTFFLEILPCLFPALLI